MMAQFQSDFSSIEQLNIALIRLLEEEDIVALNALLVKRLELLKSLDNKLHASSPTEGELEQYYDLLKQIKADDDRQLAKVTKLQKDLKKSRLDIDRGRTAVHAYKNTFIG